MAVHHVPHTLQIVGLPLIHLNAAVVGVFAQMYDMFSSASHAKPTHDHEQAPSAVERLDGNADERLYNAEDDNAPA